MLALAPTPKAASAARKVATGPWAGTARSRRALWASCAGSGRTPYQVIVDLDGPAWRCSCPSRQSPCKHVLGMLLRWVDQPGGFPTGDQPDMVEEWLGERDRRAERSAKRAAAGPPDRDAQAKRAAERQARIADGMVELDRWLGDLIRQGLARVREQPAEFWDRAGARMVDAQVPGVADRLRAIPDRIGGHDDWPQRLLTELGMLHLITAGWSRLDALPPETQADLRTVVGWHYGAEDVAAGERIGDRWVVVAQSNALTGQVRTYRTWLAGTGSGRFALLLGFTPVTATGVVRGTAPDHAAWPVLRGVDAELAFYPGSVPLRARVVTGSEAAEGSGTAEDHRTVDNPGTLAAWVTVDDALADHAAAVARNPWLGDDPVLVEATITAPADGGAWQVRDLTGAAVPLGNPDDGGWELLDRTGGHRAGLFGVWRGGRLEVLTAIPTAWLRRRPAPEAAATSPHAVTAARGVLTASPQLSGPALAGTERRPVGPLLEGAGAFTAALSRLGPEPALLGAAAAAATARQAATVPTHDHRPLPDPSPHDPRRHWRLQGSRRLEHFLQDPEVGELLLPEWLAAAAAAGLRAADGSTHWLVAHGDERPDRQALIEPILGERGRWLATRHPKGGWVRRWHLDADALEAAWQDPERHDRGEVLRRLRAVDPGRARALVSTAWPSLRREADRFGTLDGYDVVLSPDDEPVLDAALDDRAARVAARAGQLLDRLPGSRRSARMSARARTLIRWEEDAEGRLVVHLPSLGEAPRDRAAVRDRVDADRRHWLRDIVEAMPLTDWTEQTGHPPADLVDAAEAAADDQDGQAKFLLDGWCRAARWQPDVDWARALTALPNNEDPRLRTRRWMLAFDSVTRPLAPLADADRTPLLADRLAERGVDAFFVNALQTIPVSLTPALGRSVLHALAAAMGRDDWTWTLGARPVDGTGRHALRALGASLDPDLLEEARDLLTPYAVKTRARPVRALLDLLAVRREMHAEVRAAAAAR